MLEFSGLAPSPLCGMILSDFGATVTRIDKVFLRTRCQFLGIYFFLFWNSPQVVHNPIDVLTAGKRTISLNLKNPKAIDVVKRLSKSSDVVIEVEENFLQF